MARFAHDGGKVTTPKVTATEKSIGIGGHNSGPLFNVTATEGSTVNLQVEQQVARELPSFLGGVIVLFSQQSLSQYGLGVRRALPPEVLAKVEYNNLPQKHRVLVDYYRHGLVLEKAYVGVEQQNSDARYLVRRKAALAYDAQLSLACNKNSIPVKDKTAFARQNAVPLVEAVIEQLLQDYASSKELKVEQETAHLAISLIVADAVIECEVLERP